LFFHNFIISNYRLKYNIDAVFYQPLFSPALDHESPMQTWPVFETGQVWYFAAYLGLC
jgi:hypothetical protein